MPRGKYRSRASTIKEINVTPLIDVALLLLMAFMLTMPLLEYGVNVSPPALNADPLPEDNNKVINLTKDGEIVFDHNPTSPEALTQTLQAMLASGQKVVILLRADGARPYNEVMDVMKAIKKAGVKEISLITQAEKD